MSYSFQSYYAVPLAMGRLATVRNPVIDSFHINSIWLDDERRVRLLQREP